MKVFNVMSEPRRDTTHCSRSQSPSPVMAHHGVIPKVQSQPALSAIPDSRRSTRTSSSSSMASSQTSSRSTSPTRSPETLAQKILRKIKNEETFFSLEFFPPRTATAAANLISRYLLRKQLKLVFKSLFQVWQNGCRGSSVLWRHLAPGRKSWRGQWAKLHDDSQCGTQLLRHGDNATYHVCQLHKGWNYRALAESKKPWNQKYFGTKRR